MEANLKKIEADFFYRKPLRPDEAKPAFGLSAPDPDRPDHEAFRKTVNDARREHHELSAAGFKLLTHDSAVTDFYDEADVLARYYPEMQKLVAAEIGAHAVHIQSHFVRNEAEAVSGKRLGAHRLVHNDFTPQFQETILPLLETAERVPKRIAVYNLWRRFDADGLDAPLALCDSRTVSKDELIPTDLHNYGGGGGFQIEIYQSSFADQHQWYFYSTMQRNEVLMFKTYDSAEAPFLPTLHSAFDDPRFSGQAVTPRESIEARAICFFF